MPEWLQSFILTFVPLFIAIDALGNLPFIISLSEDMTRRERSKMLHIATATTTAAIVGLAFLFFGQFILSVLGISVGSFAIAGGLILLVLSVKYMTTGRLVEVVRQEMIAVVPGWYTSAIRTGNHHHFTAPGGPVPLACSFNLFHLEHSHSLAIIPGKPSDR